MSQEHPDPTSGVSWYRVALDDRAALRALRNTFEVSTTVPAGALFATVGPDGVLAYLSPTASWLATVEMNEAGDWTACGAPPNTQYLRLVCGDPQAWALVVQKLY